MSTHLTWPLSIEQAAAVLGVSKTIVRFWIEEFGLETSQRTAVSASQMFYLRICQRLIETEEMTLSDAKKAFDLEKDKSAERVALMDKLEKIRTELAKMC